ncbi:hypothetical protein GQ457_16G016380 [Hibiscus cannabinus]
MDARGLSLYGKSAPRPAARAPSNNVPSKPACSAPGSGLVAAIADGIGWGVGTAMGHRAVDAIVGPRVIKHETVASPEPAAAAAPKANMNNSDACGGQSKALSDCLSNFGSDISKCQFLHECAAKMPPELWCLIKGVAIYKFEIRYI